MERLQGTRMHYFASNLQSCLELDQRLSTQSDDLEANNPEGAAGIALQLLTLIACEVADRRLAKASFGLLGHVAGPAAQELTELLSPLVYGSSEIDLVNTGFAEYAREGSLDLIVESLD